MKRRILPILLLVFLLVSCKTLNTSLNINLIDYPSWITNYNDRAGEYSFVSQGIGEDEYGATTLAYQDLLNQISELLDKDISDSKYRELTTTKSIEEYILKIANKDTRKNSDGKTEVHLLATCNEDKLFVARSAIYQEKLKIESNVSLLVSEAEDSYRKNMDTIALDYYFQAAIASYNNTYLTTNLSYNTLVNKALDIVSDLRLFLSSSDPENIKCSIKIKRSNQFLDSKILNAQVNATVNLINNEDKIYSSTDIYSSGTSGQFAFSSIYPNIVTSSEVVFSFYLGPNYENFYSLLSAEDKAKFDELLNSQTKIFLYFKKFPAMKGGISINVLEFDEKGQLVSSTDLAEGIKDKFAQDAIDFEIYYDKDVEEEYKIEENFLTMNSENRYLVLCKMGLNEVLQRPDYYIISINGSVKIKDLSNGEVLFDTPDLQLAKFAKTKVAALEKVKKGYEELVYNLLKGYFESL